MKTAHSETADPLERALWTRARYLALGNESFEAERAFFVRNLATPRRYDANHIDLIRASSTEEIESLLARAEQEYAPSQAIVLHIDPLTPPEFVARLALDGGYSQSSGLHLILEGELQASPPAADIREVASESYWEAYRLLADRNENDYKSSIGERIDDSLLAEFHRSKRLKTPPVRAWLAYVDDEPVAFFSSWVDGNGMGLVEDLFTHPAYRHRGLATALVAHCVEDARSRGAGPVMIAANPDDTPRHIYARMGFRPRFLIAEYRKEPRQPAS